jgi:formylglycine-generating enzyme required for sulfatase activity
VFDVGSYPLGKGPYGHLDLLGSVWEWNLDYSGGVFPPADPCVECANLNSYQDRIIRGASFWEDASWINNERRHEDPPSGRWLNVGVRCARVPP